MRQSKFFMPTLKEAPADAVALKYFGCALKNAIAAAYFGLRIARASQFALFAFWARVFGRLLKQYWCRRTKSAKVAHYNFYWT